MEAITKQKINQGIKKTLSRYGNGGKESDHIEFIIDRFFHYLKLCLMHGIKCSIPSIMNFSMVYTYIKDIPRELKKTMFFSSKAFGYLFYFIADAKKIDFYGYTFRTDKTLLKSIANHNESDIIYKLIKK